MFSGVVLVDGHPKRSLSLTNVRPSLRWYHEKSFALAQGIISEGFL
jgi:hypothetical protein